MRIKLNFWTLLRKARKIRKLIDTGVELAIYVMVTSKDKKLNRLATEITELLAEIKW